MARFKIGDIIKFQGQRHMLILDITTEVNENDRYHYVVLENGHIMRGIAWHIDKYSEWIT